MIRKRRKYSRMKLRFTGFFIATVASLDLWCTTPLTAHAYVGPGVGITMIGALWGLIATIGFAIVGILLWPLRSLIRKIRFKVKLKQRS
jgi:hypothetical protein